MGSDNGSAAVDSMRQDAIEAMPVEQAGSKDLVLL